MSDGATTSVSQQRALAELGQLYLENRVLRDQIATLQRKVLELTRAAKESAADGKPNDIDN